MDSTKEPMTYARYLALDKLLSAQAPLSATHDESLFIIVHQTKELWLKQIIAELALAKRLVRENALIEAYKSLARISRIQAVMTLSWDVLATMTPSDYTSFREGLGPSSGFQSAQFRIVEYMLGFKNERHVVVQEGNADVQSAMRAALSAPSLWDDANAALSARGIAVPDRVLTRDWSKPYTPDLAVEDAWAEVYRDTHRWWDLYQLAEKLLDIDDALATWRHRHTTTVARIIGGKRGTGGSAGVSYLESTLGLRCFPELWSLRTRL
jgi:tryptophan 2,3-dioxygenase